MSTYDSTDLVAINAYLERWQKKIAEFTQYYGGEVVAFDPSVVWGVVGKRIDLPMPVFEHMLAVARGTDAVMSQRLAKVKALIPRLLRQASHGPQDEEGDWNHSRLNTATTIVTFLEGGMEDKELLDSLIDYAYREDK